MFGSRKSRIRRQRSTPLPPLNPLGSQYSHQQDTPDQEGSEAAAPPPAALRERVFSGDMHQRETKHRRQSPFWFVVSALFHAILFICLIIFTPLRKIVIPEKQQTTLKMTAEKLKKLSEHITNIFRSEMTDYIEQLDAQSEEMDMIREIMLDRAEKAEKKDNQDQQQQQQQQQQDPQTAQTQQEQQTTQEQEQQKKLEQAQQARKERTEQVKKLDIAQLYEAALKAETQVTESYRDVRAAEASLLTATPIEEARKLVDVAQPVRPELNAEALKVEARTEKKFEERKGETARAIRETQGIVETTTTLLEAARQLLQTGTQLHGSALEVMRTHLATTRAAAAENEAQTAKDLSQIMMTAPDSGTSGVEKPPPPPPPLGVAATPTPTPAPTPPPSGTEDIERNPPPFKWDMAMLPANIIGKSDVVPPTGWVYLDSWYILGPFPNPNRQNMDFKFPPETVLDLDSSYSGKDGRTIRWVYKKSPMQEPYTAEQTQITADNIEEYGIWYAYTEVYFPEPTVRWIAIGSDDKSKIWINGTLVWESAPQQKGWKPDEGFRRVYFQKGRNKILYRIENGHITMAWSLCISLNRNQ